MNSRLVPLLVAASAVLAACTGAATEDSSSDEQALTEVTARKASGYLIGGPELRGTDRVPTQLCGPMSPLVADESACDRARGTTTITNGCRLLCSKPVAELGKIAGYDFDGFQVLDVPTIPLACPTVVTEEQTACIAAGGEASGAGCHRLCSKPIARPGSVAGYDARGELVTSPAPDANGDAPCAAEHDPDAFACEAVGGTVSKRAPNAEGRCEILCSIPFPVR